MPDEKKKKNALSVAKKQQPEEETQLVFKFLVGNPDKWTPKGHIQMMEHPFFALSPKKDIEPFHYVSPDESMRFTVFPRSDGIGRPTIWDKDILIYAMTGAREARSRDENVDLGGWIHIDAHDLLAATKRSTGGKGYQGLIEGLDRLAGATIKLYRDGEAVEGEGALHLLSWVAIKDRKTKNVVKLAIQFAPWLRKALEDSREFLGYNPRYFELEGAIERRLYEICRKHVGDQDITWPIGIKKLYTKSGSKATLKEFKRMVSEVVARTKGEGKGKPIDFPDYELEFDGMTFFARSIKSIIKESLASTEEQQDMNL